MDVYLRSLVREEVPFVQAFCAMASSKAPKLPWTGVERAA